MRRLVASVALTLTATLLVPASAGALKPEKPATVPSFKVQPLVWGKCDDPGLRTAKAKCADLVVPLDHADPTGPTIKVAVARVAHTSKPYRGVMLTNPGGPGGAGRWVAEMGNFVPGGVGQTYDWIGIDPRGVGASRPALTCDGRYFAFRRPSYTPTTSAIRDAWLGRTEAYAQACGNSAAKNLLPHVKSTDTIADYEILRQALGVDKVSFYGFSYGTYLGQLYATLHPDRLDKLVLDGVVDASQAWYESNLAQDPAFERAINRFFGWTARHYRTYKLGKTKKSVRRNYQRLKRQLAVKPIRGVGPAELTDAILGAGYHVYNYPDAAKVLSAMKRGNAGPARRAYRSDNPVGAGQDNGYAMYLATQCTDAPWPHDWGTWETDNWVMHNRAPYLTWANAWFNAPCRTWPAPSSTPVKVNGQKFAGKFLLISETYDAATPFAGALATRMEFPGASLIEGVGGATHSASLSGIGCVDDAVAAYLADGTVPARRSGSRSDLHCRALKPPAKARTPLVRTPAFRGLTN